MNEISVFDSFLDKGCFATKKNSIESDAVNRGQTTAGIIPILEYIHIKYAIHKFFGHAAAKYHLAHHMALSIA